MSPAVRIIGFATLAGMAGIILAGVVLLPPYAQFKTAQYQRDCLRAGVAARKKGYADVLYLDAKEKKYMDESGPANLFAITKDGQYVTPDSPTILPSIMMPTR